MKMERPNNPRFPHTCKIVREVESDDPMEDEGEEVTIYEGRCRWVQNNTNNDKGEVITSIRKVSIPLNDVEWGKRECVPYPGDDIVITLGSKKEHGRVIDFAPNNLGSSLLFRMIGT